MNNNLRKKLFLQMLRIRSIEETIAKKYSEWKMRCPVHLSIGQETAAVAICQNLTSKDKIFTAHRSHAHYLAKGGNLKSMIAELYGKKTGCAKGKGGSMHFFSKEKKFFGGHGIVGGQIGLGAGIAFAEQYKGTDAVTVCYFGDGAARQGILHETFNMAMTWKLPVIFICENNYYAMGTSVERTSNVLDIYKFADAYDMPGDSVDGMKPEDVHEGVERAVKRARDGGGPTLLEIKTYRYKGHSMSDPAKYRTKEELEEFKLKDPIEHVLNVI
jgi:pyruvate dehydrogenase E1 component alpha subunit